MNARELALELLRARFDGAPGAHADSLDGLADFQREAVGRVEHALHRYGGALLADSVGLGKTHMGAAVARRCAGDAGVIAVVPTALLRQWRRALRGVERVAFVTHAALSRGGFRAPPPPGGLLLVDEAHGFRNPRTRRYAALARLAPGRNVLLLTATPVNNSLWDLYWLLRLFAADDAFLADGVADLFSCIQEAERSGHSGRLPLVLSRVCVRRTRAHVEAEVARSRLPLRFPARAPPRALAYPADPALQQQTLAAIDAVELAPWSLAGSGTSALLLRLTLLKRAESSRAAMHASLLRLRDALHAFQDALAAGRLLTPAERRLRRERQLDQLELPVLLLRLLPPQLDAVALHASAAADCTRIDALLHALGDAGPDPKLQRLRVFISAELRDAPLLVFTEFRDTAEYLWRQLRDEFPTALIHGSGAFLGRSAASRRTVVERFAPRANSARPPAPRERVQLLIATDVLAEGLNLQDCADVLSWDLPWNPVLLLQRIGRIDRLGSPHPLVHCAYFAPDAGLDTMLRLLQRLQRKLHAIRTSVGEDGPVMAAPVMAPRAGAGALGLPLGPPPDWESAERARAAFLDGEERLRAAWRGEGAAARGLDGLPLGELPRQPGAAPHEGPPCSPPGAERPYRRRRCAALRPPAVAGLSHVQAVAFFGKGSGQRAVLIGPRGCFEDDALAAETLLHALRALPVYDCPDPHDCRALVRRAARWLLLPAAEAPPRAPLRRLRRRLLRLLQAHAGGASAVECRRAERLLDRLDRTASVAAVLELARLSRNPARHNSFAALAEAIERALSAEGGSGGQAAAPGPGASRAERAQPRFRPRFQGMFRLVPELTGGVQMAIVTGSKVDPA